MHTILAARQIGFVGLVGATPPPAAPAGPTWAVAGGIDPATIICCYQPKDAASLAASYTNLANPGTNDALPGSTPPSWAAATGWEFQWGPHVITPVVPTETTFVQCRYSDAGTYNNYVFGAMGDGTRGHWFFAPWYNGTQVRYAGDNEWRAVAPIMLAGVVGMSSHYGYRNGVLDSDYYGYGPGTPLSLYIGGVHAAGGLDGPMPSKVQAFVAYTAVPTDAQILAVANAMAAL